MFIFCIGWRVHQHLPLLLKHFHVIPWPQTFICKGNYCSFCFNFIFSAWLVMRNSSVFPSNSFWSETVWFLIFHSAPQRGVRSPGVIGVSCSETLDSGEPSPSISYWSPFVSSSLRHLYLCRMQLSHHREGCARECVSTAQNISAPGVVVWDLQICIIMSCFKLVSSVCWIYRMSIASSAAVVVSSN